MFTEQAVFFYYTETPLHAGSGSSVTYVDLPIQREKHTDHPIVQASGVKGAFRSWAKGIYKYDEEKNEEIKKAFGPERKGDESSGTLSFTDAQILLFPVRSFAGVFAWITCPLVISRFCRMLKASQIAPPEDHHLLLNDNDDEQALVKEGSSLIVNPKQENKRLILEDFSFAAVTESSDAINKFAEWLATNALPEVREITTPPGQAAAANKINDDPFAYIKKELPGRLAVLSDNRFRDFVTLSTDVQTRISINDETGVVAEGPWNEEMLLPDTLLYNLVLGKTMNGYSAEQAVSFAQGIVDRAGIIQMGGDETLGRGLVRVRYCKEEKKGVADGQK